MRTCKKLHDVGRPILYRTPVLSTARFKGPVQGRNALIAEDRAWQLLGTLRSDQSTADLVCDSRHLDKGFECSRTRTAISGPSGELYDYSLEEAILEVCRFITDAAVTLYSCEQATRVGKLLSCAPNLRSLVIHGPSPSPKPRAFTGGLADLPLNGIGSASAPSASTELDILTSCLQAFVPAARSAVPPLATLDTPIIVHDCDPEICRLALMVRKAARNFKVRTGGHAQLLCYGMPRRSFLYNPDLPRVTSVTISITDGEQSIDLTQLAHDLDGNILDEFVFDLSTRRQIRAYVSDTRPTFSFESSGDSLAASAFPIIPAVYAGPGHGNHAAFERSAAFGTPFYPEPWLDLLRDYSGGHFRFPRCPYSDKWYTLFPHARKLCLPRGLDMDLSKLSALVETSPNLEYLDLAETEWSIGADALAVEQPGDLSKFEQALVQILERLAHLSYVHLGHWPFVDQDGTDVNHGRLGLAAWARGRGIELLVSGCSPNPD